MTVGKIEFVGGSQDGKLMAVPLESMTDEYKFAVLDLGLVWDAMNARPASPVRVRPNTLVYRREQLSSETLASVIELGAPVLYHYVGIH